MVKKSRWPNISRKLVENSISAMFSAIEIHNKPNFSYRYESSVILLINAWELILKAYIYKNKLAKLRYIDERKQKKPKPFLDCLSCVRTKLWKDFANIWSSIEKLYEYRCNFIHFYWDNLNPIIFLLMTEDIKLYVNFIKKYFPNYKFNNNDLIILPIGFQSIANPIDIIWEVSESKKSSKEVKDFIKSIIQVSQDLYEQWIEDGIITCYNIHLLNQNSSKTSEFVAKRSKDWIPINKISKVQISDDPNARKVKFDSYEEEKSFQNENYPLTHLELLKEIRLKYPSKLRSGVAKTIKKYQKNTNYSYVCRWETQIKYKNELVDVIWNSFPENPRLEHLKKQ